MNAKITSGSIKESKILNSKIFLVFAIIILVDQLTKYLIKLSFAINETKVIISGFFSLAYFANTGAGFGILAGRNLLIIILTFIVLIILSYVYYTNYLNNIFMELIMAGALSNLIDRLINGFVVDFIYFHFWPAFNVADMMITLGVASLILSEIKKEYMKHLT